MAIFGSYIGKDHTLMGESINVAILDTFVALVSGLIIFPACFTYNNGVTADAGSVGAGFLFTTLSAIFNAMPGAVTQGMLWGIMAIGVYLTFRILNVSDLTVDGSLATGGAVCVMLMRAGCNPWIALLCAFLAGMLAGLVTGLLHTRCAIPAILSGILTQLALYSINLRIMGGKANQPIGVDKYDLLVSQRYVRDLSL